MRRALPTLAVALATLFGVLDLSPRALADEAGWHSETPVAAGIDVPEPLGEIGDIEFWAPNRGVLITAGNDALPAGVYAYDGTGWRLYSSVCGGHEGRIAWAGPEEFWTVSDYATPQEGNQGSAILEHARTLCHFEGGKVVASYAEPLGAPAAYQQMGAAACDGPSNCWFAGEPLLSSAANAGAFHLHWDGGSLTAVPSAIESQPQIEDPGGTISALEFLDGRLYEAATQEPFLREVSLARPGLFSAVTLPEGATGPFDLGGDGAQLWAVGQDGESALRSVGAGFEAVELERPLGATAAAASEPNGAAVWAAGAKSTPTGEAATVTRVSADGSVAPTVTLPDPSEEIDPKGGAAVIACPSPGQCWLATKKGWLFHLGGSLPQDLDPAMHTLISFRPPDNSTRSFVPAGVPEDNSGESERAKTPFEELPGEKFPHSRKARQLVSKVHQKIIGRTILELSFILHGRAHVQLLAKRHRKVVAKTPKLTLSPGPHSLRLRLDPKRWPTGLDFHVHPAGKR
jgi:hypothetical protein